MKTLIPGLMHSSGGVVLREYLEKIIQIFYFLWKTESNLKQNKFFKMSDTISRHPTKYADGCRFNLRESGKA